jgi:hypothetical protein
MKTPSFRFAVRALMALVAVAAVLIWTIKMRQRSLEYEGKSNEHASTEQYLMGIGDAASGIMSDGRIWSKEERVGFYRALRIKYKKAALCPWLAVEPDPPEAHPMPGFDIRSMEGR